jgi:hypothetical protein
MQRRVPPGFFQDMAFYAFFNADLGKIFFLPGGSLVSFFSRKGPQNEKTLPVGEGFFANPRAGKLS